MGSRYIFLMVYLINNCKRHWKFTGATVLELSHVWLKSAVILLGSEAAKLATAWAGCFSSQQQGCEVFYASADVVTHLLCILPVSCSEQWICGRSSVFLLS